MLLALVFTSLSRIAKQNFQFPFSKILKNVQFNFFLSSFSFISSNSQESLYRLVEKKWVDNWRELPDT